MFLDAGDSINRGLKGFWPLDEDGGLISRDISPAKLHLRWDSNAGRRVGPTGKTANFNYAGTGMTNAQFFLPAGTPLTILASTYWTNSASYQSIIGIGTGTGYSPRVWVYNYLNNTLYWDYEAAIGPNVASSSYINRWVNWAFVCNGTTRSEIWADGVRVATGTVNTLASSYTGVWVGCRPGGTNEPWNGGLSAVRTIFRALEPAELQRVGRDPWAGVKRSARRVYRASSGAFTPIIMGSF